MSARNKDKEVRDGLIEVFRAISKLTQVKTTVPLAASPVEIAHVLLDRLEKIDEVCGMAIEGLSGERRRGV